MLKQKEVMKMEFLNLNLIKLGKLKQNPCRSLSFLVYILCSLSCVAKQQGNNFSLILPVVFKAGGEKGTQWKHCGVSVCLHLDLVAGWPPVVLMSAPPDGRLAEAPHVTMACGQSMLPFSCSQNGAAHFKAQGRTNKRLWRHSPLCAVCVSFAKTRLL